LNDDTPDANKEDWYKWINQEEDEEEIRMKKV